MLTVDPNRLARRQIALDGERTAAFPYLAEHKVARMTASPLALLRGSAPLFYELLDRHPALREGPGGEGWLAGDVHLENFGAYRAGALSMHETKTAHANEPVIFDLNDFDDAFIGPWRFDVLRLLTSLVLGSRGLGADGGRTLELCDALLEAYLGAAFHRKRPPADAPVVATLIENVQTRTRKALLDARTEVVSGRRRFVLGTRYRAISPSLRKKAERAFAKYAGKLGSSAVPDEALTVLDAAFRVAGTGSLGCLRIALLVAGKGGPDGAWIFDMKEEGTPSAARLVRPPKMDPADRVCTALDACLRRPPRMIGTTRIRKSSMFVRRLAPQEDKVDLTRLAIDDLEPLARQVGALLGAAHRRGATHIPKAPWSPKDRARMLDRALALAGLHEAMYLAYCDLVRE